ERAAVRPPVHVAVRRNLWTASRIGTAVQPGLPSGTVCCSLAPPLICLLLLSPACRPRALPFRCPCHAPVQRRVFSRLASVGARETIHKNRSVLSSGSADFIQCAGWPVAISQPGAACGTVCVLVKVVSVSPVGIAVL